MWREPRLYIPHSFLGEWNTSVPGELPPDDALIPVNLELVKQLWLPNIFIYNLKTFKVAFVINNFIFNSRTVEEWRSFIKGFRHCCYTQVVEVLSKHAGLWITRDKEIMYSQATHINFICPMRFDNFPLDTQVKSARVRKTKLTLRTC